MRGDYYHAPWAMHDGGASGGTDIPVTPWDTLWIEQDITSHIPSEFRLVAQLFIDGEVVAESYPTRPLPPRREPFAHFLRFQFPTLALPVQYYGLRYYAITPDGQRLRATITPAESC